MSIFNLHSNVLADYRDFVRSFFSGADDRAREFIDRELVEQARLWPEALLQVSPSYTRVAALVVYPMNALVNSQLEALKKLKRGCEQRTGRRFPISFAKYTGDVQGDARREVQTHPPQILLTNYVMAELLLLRPDDQSLLPPAGPDGLRYFVFDELHTYRGRQGADVAMLIRRTKCCVRRHERHDGRQP